MWCVVNHLWHNDSLMAEAPPPSLSLSEHGSKPSEALKLRKTADLSKGCLWVDVSGLQLPKLKKLWQDSSRSTTFVQLFWYDAAWSLK